MRKRLFISFLISVIAVILSACAELPAGDYVVYPGTPQNTPLATWQGSGYSFVLVSPPASATPR